MKKALILIIAIMMAAPAFAQMETIFSGKITNGWYLAPEVKLGDISGETGVWAGLKGGWVINHSFVIGGAGYGLVSENKKNDSIIPLGTRVINCGYGGFMMEYIMSSNKIAHVTAGVLIGAGGAGHRYIDDYEDYYRSGSADDAFFALEPNLGVELNISRYIRAEIGATYLYTSGVELIDLDDEDLDGANGYFALKFGIF